MFGKILEVQTREITLENKKQSVDATLLGGYIVFVIDDKKVVAEVTLVSEKIIKCFLVGFIWQNRFYAGGNAPLSSDASIRPINADELALILGDNNLAGNSLVLGKSYLYEKFNVLVKLNDFFSFHNAIVGNTGSGKSCGLTRILQNLFLGINTPFNAHFVLFDAYGEYVNAFDMIKEKGLTIQKYSSINAEERFLKYPAYFLETDDLAILLGATNAQQIAVLDKTLKLVSIFKSKSPKMQEYKNDIIAKCIMDILTSGKSSSSTRDQVIAVLSHYNTKDLNLESIIHQPGYDRTLRQCLLIDEQGKINAIYEVMNFLSNFEIINIDNIDVIKDFAYDLEDLYYALEFALISEGTLNSDEAYKQVNILKTRLQAIINSPKNNIFKYDDFIDYDKFMKDMFVCNNLTIIDLSDLESRFAKVLTKLYSKLIFNYLIKNRDNGSFSFNIILEEAHRYVQNDSDEKVIGYNIFNRITKEGRKYGCLMTFITQRPSELSSTALSQCANYLVFRVIHPADLEQIEQMSTHMSLNVIEKIKELNAGVCYAFGTGFKMPLLIKLEMPKVAPKNASVDVASLWYEEEML